MSFVRAVFSRRFMKNLLAGAVVLLVFPGLFYLYLGWYTGHGQRKAVPDVRGVNLSEAAKLLDESQLAMMVVDSVYTEGAVPGMVFEQSPPPFSEVKKSRTVYLTVYRTTPPMEQLKVAEGTNERVAEIILQNKGIRFDKQYEEHAYLAGMVVRVLYRGKELTPESGVQRGDRVTLIIGIRSNEKVEVPNLIGLTIDSALFVIADRRLAHGVTLYDHEVQTSEDSLMARVYRQHPSAEGEKPILVGTPVDVYLGINKTPETPETFDDLDDFDLDP